MHFPNRPEGDYDDDFDLEDQLTEQREEGFSPLIVGAAIVGLLVGLFLWGSIALSAVSGVGDLFDDDTGPAAGDEADAGDGTPSVAETAVAVDCDAFGGTRALSPEQEAAFQEQCLTPTPAPADATPEAPADATVNRESCEEIRGTDYRSPEERQWFLGNCVN